MSLYFFITSFIKCTIDAEIEEMFREFEDTNEAISRDGELYRYLSDPNITLFCDKNDKTLKISCNLEHPFVSEELSKFKNLEKLHLSENRFKELPSSFCSLIKLSVLNLNRNLFTEIPSVIFELEQLRYLDLSSNHITEIPCDITKLKNLHTLLLSNNHIHSISHYLKQCTSIKVLSLEGNEKLYRLTLDSVHISQEISLFSKLPKELEHLNLSNTKLHFIPEMLDFPNLLSLDLSNNFLKNLDGAFRNLRELQMLNLDNNEISIFPFQLYRLQKLIKLSMCENQIGEVIFPELSCVSLKSLILDDNQLEKLSMHSSSLRKLYNLSLENTRLQSFSIKDASIIHHIHKLKTGRPLTCMKIKQLIICFESLDYIGDLFDLQELLHLSITCLSKDMRTPEDRLLQKLSRLQKLTILSMENCGLKIFPKSLLGLGNLTTVDLSGNLITEVPRFIKDLLIKKIFLERNCISKIPVEIFHNSCIEYIELRSNRIENLPRDLSKHDNFTGIINISNNQIGLFGNAYFSGIFDIPYIMVENIVLESKQLDVEPQELTMGINTLLVKSRYIWKGNGILDLKTQRIKEHILDWDGIKSIFDMLKDKISDINLQDSTLTYLKKVYQIGEHQNDISVMYGESQRNRLQDYIEEILKLLVIFLEKEDNTMIENCFILLENAHNVCFDGQLEHLIEIHKILTGRDLNCLKTTICNILVRYKYEGLKLITTSNSYSENVHILSSWRNYFSEVLGFENIPNLYSVNIENALLNSEAYILIQLFKHLNVDKIVEELKNEINENSNLMTEGTQFLFQLFEEDLDKLKIMVTYNGEIEDLLFTGVTVEGVETILSEYGLIRKNI